MSDRDASPSAPQAAALATLGLVALVISLLTQRVLPRLIGCAQTDAAVLRLQSSMAVLAALAWRQIEAPEEEAQLLDAMEGAALALRAALLDLLTGMGRMRRPAGLPGAARRMAPSSARPIPAPALPATPRARDGPPPQTAMG